MKLLSLTTAAVALLLSAAPAMAQPPMACKYNGGKIMLMNVSSNDAGFSVRWQDGAANQYTYNNEDLAPTVTDKYGGIWWVHNANSEFRLTNMKNGNIIDCRYWFH